MSNAPVGTSSPVISFRVRATPREVNAARADADQGKIIDALVAFDYFVGDAGEGAGNPVRIHDDWHAVPLGGLSGPRLKSRTSIAGLEETGQCKNCNLHV